jgi:hypothetical protein
MVCGYVLEVVGIRGGAMLDLMAGKLDALY